jgi:hypothetical protein
MLIATTVRNVRVMVIIAHPIQQRAKIASPAGRVLERSDAEVRSRERGLMR